MQWIALINWIIQSEDWFCGKILKYWFFYYLLLFNKPNMLNFESPCPNVFVRRGSGRESLHSCRNIRQQIPFTAYDSKVYEYVHVLWMIDVIDNIKEGGPIHSRGSFCFLPFRKLKKNLFEKINAYSALNSSNTFSNCNFIHFLLHFILITNKDEQVLKRNHVNRP